MIKNKKLVSLGLSLLVVIILGYVLNAFFIKGNLKPVETATSTPVVTVPYVPVTVPLDNWQKFSAKENFLKRDVKFSYPKEWVTDGANGGGPSATLYFTETNKNSLAWKTSFFSTGTAQLYPGIVLAMRIVSSSENQIPNPAYDYLSSNPFTEIYKKAVTLDGKNGVSLKREVTLPTGEKRLEYWAIFKNIDNKVYEFSMRGDLYTNSEEVFTRLLQTLKWGAVPVD